MSMLIEDYIPVVKYEGLNTDKNVVIGGNLTVSGTTNIAAVSLTNLTVTGNTAIGNATSDTLTVIGASSIQSTSASALVVGRQGATSPQLKVDASTSSVVTGLEIIGAASGAGLAVRAIGGGTNENMTLDAKGSGTMTINGTATGIVVLPAGTTIGGSAVAALGTVTSSDAAAIAVGPNGATNPVFQIDASTGSAAAGLKITGATAAGTVAAAVISSGADAELSIAAKGTGSVAISNPFVKHTPTAANSTATLTAAQVKTGYITSTSAAATELTLPTGTDLGTALGATQGTIHELYIDNTAGANTVTIAVSVNGVLSDAATTTAASFGQLTVASGVTGLARFTLMFSSATAFAFTRTA